MNYEVINVPQKLKCLMPYLKDYNGYIVGGVFKDILLDKPFKDIDIVFECYEDYKKAFAYFKDNYLLEFEDSVWCKFRNNSNVVVHLTKNKFYPINECLDRFDFTIVKVALSSKGILHYHPMFFIDLVNKTLRAEYYNSSKKTADDIHRLVKYIQYGFNPTYETLGKFIVHMRRLKDDWILTKHEEY